MLAGIRVAILGAAMTISSRGAGLEIEAELVQATPTPEVADIAPYPRALCTYLYAVKAVHEGEYEGGRILVVKWAVWEKQKLEGLPSKVGAVERLTLDRWIDHPGFERERVVDAIGETDLVMYYDTSSGPAGSGPLVAGQEAGLARGVVKGDRAGWLFLAEELRHAATRRFWEKDWKDVSRAGVDPIPAMVDFQKRLEGLGVKLLIVPVPAKVAIYPECLGTEVRIEPLGGYVKRMREAGLEVLDLEPIFAAGRTRARLHPLYCRSDTHWSPAACDIAALEIQQRIQLPARDLPAGVQIDANRTLTIRGDLARLLDEPGVAPERIRHNGLRFTDGRGSVGLRHPDSPLVLLGDSHVTVFSEGGEEMHGAGAGLPDHLLLQLGMVPDVIASHGDGVHQARVNLYQQRSIHPDYPDYWANKKWVVWVFAAREFTGAEQWSTKIPVHDGR